MVISTRYKYLFIEHPHTGSTAIARELVTLYDGAPILHKYALYDEFSRWAMGDRNKYHVFASVRHPMDIAVCQFFHFKTNHGGHYTDPDCHKINGGWIDERTLRKYEFVRNSDASFERFIRRVLDKPYVPGYLSHLNRLDDSIRFESIQEDFERVLNNLNIEKVRPLPRVNATKRPGGDFLSFYTRGIRQRAIEALGPMMRLTGYEIPPHWDVTPVRTRTWIRFCVLYAAKSIYARYGSPGKVQSIPTTYSELVADETRWPRRFVQSQ